MRQADTLSVLAAMGAASCAMAGGVSLVPVADTFVDSAQPSFNYGGAGAMQIAAPGSAQGEFDAVMRFDASSLVSTLNSEFPGGWTIQSVTLQLSAAFPNNPLFNQEGAGTFAIDWMENDGWGEGSGMPSTPDASGVNYSSLPTFLSVLDERLGVFIEDGSTSGTATYTLGLPPGFTSDLSSGSLVSLHLYVPEAGAYTFHSRSFPTIGQRPVLSVTAMARPGCGSADFNGDGDTGTDADIEAFFACLAGNCCPTCGSADFNADGDTGTDADIEAFFRVLAGGDC